VYLNGCTLPQAGGKVKYTTSELGAFFHSQQTNAATNQRFVVYRSDIEALAIVMYG